MRMNIKAEPLLDGMQLEYMDQNGKTGTIEIAQIDVHIRFHVPLDQLKRTLLNVPGGEPLIKFLLKQWLNHLSKDFHEKHVELIDVREVERLKTNPNWSGRRLDGKADSIGIAHKTQNTP